MSDFKIEDGVLIKYEGNEKNVIIPEGVTEIGFRAFEDCINLISLEMPETVTEIGSYAFSCCENLEEIIIPKSVTEIAHNAFYRTKWYNNQPDGFVIINNILYGHKCKNRDEIKTIKIPDGVKKIVDFAFSDYIGLENIEIPKSVTEMGQDVFLRTTWLFNQLNKLVIIGNILYGYRSFNKSKMKAIEIPYGVEILSRGVFHFCQSLTDVIIPNSVKTIGKEAFSFCKSLENIVLPDSVTIIGERAFEFCENLTEVVIPNSVKTIGKGAFGFCKSLKNIALPDSVTIIGKGAFEWCNNLTEVVIPNSVKSIEKEAFKDCHKLEKLVILKGVTDIKEYAFWLCKSLKNVVLPDSVTAIGKNAFQWCNNLEKLTIPEHLDISNAGVPENCEIIRIPSKTTALEMTNELERIEFPESTANISVKEENNTNYENVNMDDFFDRILKEAMDKTQTEK